MNNLFKQIFNNKILTILLIINLLLVIILLTLLTFKTFKPKLAKLFLKSNPDWIFINTWNEWPEHTYIEPSVKYGNLYLDITKENKDKWEEQ